MKLRRTLTCTVGLMGLHVAVASPASAAAEIRADTAPITAAPSVAAPAVAALAGPVDARCARPIEPSFGGRPSAAEGFGASKASAILGGKMSRLELIAMQQAGPAPTPMAAAPLSQLTEAQPEAAAALPDMAGTLPGDGLEPAAGGFACPAPGQTGFASAGFAATGFSRPGVLPLLGRRPLGSEDFLASKRLPVSRTTFDASWARVQDSALPRGMVRRALGSGDRTVTRERIAAINAWTNQTVRYVEDRDLYGRSDYWASARTTLKRRAGDCEDIAIAKMQLLAAMGVPRGDMYLTIARDLARNADHAMLVVKFEGEHLLLDNATNDVLDASLSYDYRPILSFSAAQSWLHGY